MRAASPEEIVFAHSPELGGRRAPEHVPHESVAIRRGGGLDEAYRETMVIVVQKSYHPAVIDDQKVLIDALQWVWLALAIETAHFLTGEGSRPLGA